MSQRAKTKYTYKRSIELLSSLRKSDEGIWVLPAICYRMLQGSQSLWRITTYCPWCLDWHFHGNGNGRQPYETRLTQRGEHCYVIARGNLFVESIDYGAHRYRIGNPGDFGERGPFSSNRGYMLEFVDEPPDWWPRLPRYIAEPFRTNPMQQGILT